MFQLYYNKIPSLKQLNLLSQGIEIINANKSSIIVFKNL